MRLPGALPHIAVVSDRRAASGRLLCIHNVGQGARLEDILAEWRLAGRFRYAPAPGGQAPFNLHRRG